jgi:hypothetical protein
MIRRKHFLKSFSSCCSSRSEGPVNPHEEWSGAGSNRRPSAFQLDSSRTGTCVGFVLAAASRHHPRADAHWASPRSTARSIRAHWLHHHPDALPAGPGPRHGDRPGAHAACRYRRLVQDQHRQCTGQQDRGTRRVVPGLVPCGPSRSASRPGRRRADTDRVHGRPPRHVVSQGPRRRDRTSNGNCPRSRTDRATKARRGPRRSQRTCPHDGLL